MSQDAAQFDEDFGAKPIRATPPPTDGPAADVAAPLTAEALGTLLCRVPYTHLATGEQGEVILSAADWQALLDRHHLTITRRTP